MARGKKPKSVYARGKRFLLFMFLSAILIVWIIPFTASEFGPSAEGVMLWIMIPLTVLLLPSAVLAAFFISCPKCGKPIFMRGIWSVPWPEKRCSKCGHDLTISDQSKRTAWTERNW